MTTPNLVYFGSLEARGGGVESVPPSGLRVY